MGSQNFARRTKLPGGPMKRIDDEIFTCRRQPHNVESVVFLYKQIHRSASMSATQASPGRWTLRSRKLNLSLECRQSGGIIVIHCAGRIVYREEAAALSRKVGKALRHTREVVLDLAGVGRLDSAGLGGLVLVHNSAESKARR
jgi:ABC-type transporter Mla MlaB component